MPNRPSQMCQCCLGTGVIHRKPAGWGDPCPACGARGVITIRLARALGWRPIRHRKRIKRPATLEMFK